MKAGVVFLFLLMPPVFAASPDGGAASSNLIANGDFEQPPGPRPSPLPGWTITGVQAANRGIQLMRNGPQWPGPANGGRHSVNLGQPGAYLHQDIATIPGRSYRLTFQSRLNWQSHNLFDTINVSVSDSAAANSEVFVAAPDSSQPNQWQEHPFSFTARGRRTRIQFARGLGSSPGVALDNIAVTEQPADTADDISGEWLDSQANRIRITDSGGAVTLSSHESWVFAANETTTVRAELALAGSRAGRQLQLAQATNLGRVVFKGSVGAGGFIRATMELPGVSHPVDLALARPLQTGARKDKQPQRIHLDLLKQSIEIGKWIPVFVGLEAADGEIVAPDRVVEIQLNVTGGRPIPPLVKLTPREPRVPAGIVMDETSAHVVASGPGLEPARASADGCRKGEIQRIRMSITASRAPADGRRHLPVKVTFLGADDSLVTNGLPKPLGWRLEGVGELRNLPDALGRPQDVAVAGDECVSRNEVVSQEAGAAIVTASFRTFSETATLHFTAPLTAASILFVLLGALCGGVVSALQNYRAAVKWRQARWTAWLFSAVAGGTALYLAYYYGVLKLLPSFPSGNGFGFLAGLAGGFLGAVALERLAGILLPPKVRSAEHA